MNSPDAAVSVAPIGSVQPIGFVQSVCVLHEVIPDEYGSVGRTAIDKRPVNGSVHVTEAGLADDQRCDMENHGSTDQAVYAYAEEDARHFEALLQGDVPPGQFGENLRISGINLNEARQGQRWRIGQDLVVEVTFPRIPCSTFGRWMDRPGWVKLFVQQERPGAYLAVVQPGAVQAGDAIVSVDSAAGAPLGPSIVQQFRDYYSS